MNEKNEVPFSVTIHPDWLAQILTTDAFNKGEIEKDKRLVIREMFYDRDNEVLGFAGVVITKELLN